MRTIIVAAAIFLETAAELAHAAPPRDMGRGAPAPPTSAGMEGAAVESTIPDHSTPTGTIAVAVPSLDVLGAWVSKEQAAALKDRLPLILQLPVSDAATICGVDASVLAAKNAGFCTANIGSRALADGVIREMKKRW